MSPPAWSAPWEREARKLVSLAVPAAATQIGSMLMHIVDMAMVGGVGVQAIAAVALANIWIFNVTMFAAGILFGLDPIVAQAHGAGNGARAGRALQHGLVLSALLSLPACALLFATERVLLFAGQDPALAHLAQGFTAVQIPSVPFFLAYFAMRQYLQGRELVRPALFVIGVANVVNVALNWVFVYGHLGAPALGAVGAGLATSISRVLTCAGLALLMLRWQLQRGAWVPWSRAALDARGLREVVSYGLPTAFQIFTEMSAFSCASLLAGRLGTVPLAAHTIAMSIASFSFMMPLGVAAGAATRVGNLIGAGQPHVAQRASWVALALGAGVMSLAALAFVTLREWLPLVYTRDAQVIAVCASILPIAAAFQIFDGTQVVGCGVLRGMGRVRPALVFNLISYWALGLPIGAWLAFPGAWGLAGVWWGLVLGLFVVAALLVGWIAYRGPAHRAAPAVREGLAQASGSH